MGCCQTRNPPDRSVERAVSKKSTVLALLREHTDCSSLTLQSFNPLFEPSPSLSEVAKLVDTEEPELFVAVRTLEEVLLSVAWVDFTQQESIRVKYLIHSDLGLMLSSQLCFKKAIPTELILRVFNTPQSRPLWDSSIDDLLVIEGNPMLDASLELTTKQGLKTKATRYVREYHDSLVCMQFVNEPATKDDDLWIRHCTEVQWLCVWQTGKATLVEVANCKQGSAAQAVCLRAKEYTTWALKFFNEVQFQMPK